VIDYVIYWRGPLPRPAPHFNPFLFIRGLSCPRSIQDSLSLNCIRLTIPRFPHNSLHVLWWHWLFKKNPRSSIGLEIRPQSAFSDLRVLLPSANYSAEWSGWVWQSSADSNGLLEHHYFQQRAVTPDPESFNSNKKGAKLPLLSAEGLSHLIGWAAVPSDNISGRFFKGGEAFW
jgi:hypothetical protein